jgi:hypothetical protein
VKPVSSTPFSLVAAATATSVVAIAQQVMGRATRDALFLSSFPVERLPAMMIVAAAASLAASIYIGRLITMLSPARVIPWLFGTSGVLLLAEWAFATAAPRPLSVVIYLHWAVFGGTLVSTFWSVINERFDPRAAKRYVGWIASGGTAGGILGGVAAFGAARTIGLKETLLALAAMHLLCGVLSVRLSQGGSGALREKPKAGTTVPSALNVLGEVGYLRNLAVLVTTVSAMEALADYALNAAAAAKWAQGNELMSFFSIFHMMVSVVTFLLQVLAGRLALERLGLVGAMAILPLFTAAGAAVAAIAPHLWSAVALRGAMAAIGNSLYRSGYELLFGPLPLDKKRPTKTVIDVGFDRLGTTLGGGFALSMIALLPSLVPAALLVAVLGLAVFSFLVTKRLQGGYVRLLEESLTVAPALKGSVRPELGLSQTFGRMDRADLMREIEALRRENLLVSGEMTSPFAWFDVPEPSSRAASALPATVAARGGAAAILEARASDGLDAALIAASPPAHGGAHLRTEAESSLLLGLSAGKENDRIIAGAAEGGNALSENPVASLSPAVLTAGAVRSLPSLSPSSAPPNTDQLVAQTAVLLAGDIVSIRTVLQQPALDPRLAPHAIVLLANDRIQRDAVRALRTISNRVTGQLVDALLDRTAPPQVRRRVARVMSTCTTQRAVDGLVEGLFDDSFEVRYQCGLTLLKITEDAKNFNVSKENVLAAVRREVDLERKLWQHQPPLAAIDEEGDVTLVDGFLRDRTSRSLQHVFSILALVFEREPMRLALTALSGEDEILRGTALEYLDEVLPADVRGALWPYVAHGKPREKARAGAGES